MSRQTGRNIQIKFWTDPEGAEKFRAWLGGYGVTERMNAFINNIRLQDGRLESRILIEEARGIRAELRQKGGLLKHMASLSTLTQAEKDRIFALGQEILKTAQELRTEPFWERHNENSLQEN